MAKQETAVVLLSGGQDSTTCLFWAKQRFEKVYALSVDYGQRHKAELECAGRISASAGVEGHHVLTLEALGQIGDSDLVREGTEIMSAGGYFDEVSNVTLPTSFVPGRNILLLALCASYGAKVGARHLVTGVCQTDFSGYPDCREDFVQAMNEAINLGLPSSCRVQIHTPLMHLTKAETVKLAASLGDECMKALGESLTCYYGQRPGCGVCPSCALRAKGFAEAGIADPAL